MSISSINSRITTLLLFLIIVVGALTVFYFKDSFINTFFYSPADHAEEETKVNDWSHINESLQGLIVFTGIEKEYGAEQNFVTTNQNLSADTYVLNLNSNTEEKIQGPVLNLPVWYPIGDGNDHYLFVTKSYDTGSPAIFMRNNTEEISEKMVDSSLNGWSEIRLLEASKDNKFYSFSVNTGTSSVTGIQNASIGNWQIYTAAIAEPGSPVYTAEGYGAVWVADEYILYVKEDGVYCKKFSGTSTNYEVEPELRLVSFTDSPLGMHNAISVSNDGQYLAVAFPRYSSSGESSVEIYKLSFDETSVSAESIYTIKKHDGLPMFRPVFSPQGRYLAVTTVSATSSDEGQIIIYDLALQEFIYEEGFDNFYLYNSFLYDWQ